ncbi:rcc01693 family protein [Palleronia sp. LCG004]|uniref:rcc01693 family protein n=1 Tax=Palleronia sp. LCG004 TaxID=3079304 RepID=UPI0029439F56|nr:rcc01693 family protein [Palleronia sp. LCG004]WOI55009.1 phage tail assembly chaperone [Palleronia sp. LCG004]
MKATFDWPGLMRAGMRTLGLRPAEFWALTPAELWLMMGLDAGPMPLGRERLAELSAAFPDERRI